MEKHILLFGKFLLTTCNQPSGAPFCDRATTVITSQAGLGLAVANRVQHARSVVIAMPWNLRRLPKSAPESYYWLERRNSRQRWFTEKMARALVIGVVRPLDVIEPSGPRSFWDGDRAGRVKRMERAMTNQKDALALHVEVGDGYLRRGTVGPAYSPYVRASKGAS